MKYIKLFEDKIESCSPDMYWKVSLSSPEYEISISKIIKNDKTRKDYLKSLVLFKGLYPDSKYFYLSEQDILFPDGVRDVYNYSKYPFTHTPFKGKVEVTKEEIDQWNMEHDAEKYNL